MSDGSSTGCAVIPRMIDGQPSPRRPALVCSGCRGKSPRSGRHSVNLEDVSARLLFRVLFGFVLTTCVLSTPLDISVASADPCPDIEVVFARGTGEAPGVGGVGQAFVDSVRAQAGGKSVNAYAVNYAAADNFSERLQFAQTVIDGIRDAMAHIEATAANCPNTKIVLGGYSQGAAVVDMLAGIPPLGNKIGEIGKAPPLASILALFGAAVAVFGNPATKFSNPITRSVFGGRAIDLCKDGDPICSRGRNPFAHSDYVSAGLTDQAANYVAGII